MCVCVCVCVFASEFNYIKDSGFEQKEVYIKIMTEKKGDHYRFEVVVITVS